MKWMCNDCEGKPCVLELPTTDAPEVCVLPDEDGAGAHFCNWEAFKSRRKGK